ncbi:leucyl/phenylalanyl-tRNA--protein transferase [Flagellimonas eckloniae]|uniref:Leucyl/phenylalanyl-tRNA--protein transferase n=1 Tax=Flagellimonas eckloniae TaxID=346185 RepID=A0A0Q0WZV1_9FLAO|nr:leucyl/phenylalanyl-tRNA--protein transferase [Allomuricauda eckloniae]KQC30929.1 leucyl/phenylalanyl-tRNA--protein transferase [Allomuricauda eckloniae]
MEKDSKKLPLFFLGDRLEFPPVEAANEDGLLAVGGDLSPERLLLAYKSGIFPWFNEDNLILWWSPNPRMVLFPNKIKISKSMRKVIRTEQFNLTQNTCFEKVLDNCAKVQRKGQDGTWITPKMKLAYLDLFEKGFAKSFEVWEGNNLVGGLYGIDLGHVFCGESMFSTVPNASKFAFIKLTQELEQEKYRLIDCQVHTKHLESLGAEQISREDFMNILQG